MPQEIMGVPSIFGILILVLVVVSFAIVMLWKRGKTVEAMLAVNALLQFIIILILLFKLE